jgi:hypothetical protein
LTPDVCYDFSQLNTGTDYADLIHGSGCHCTPYYKEAGGGDSVCALGEGYLAMGEGYTYEMHLCADTAGDVATFFTARRLCGRGRGGAPGQWVRKDRRRTWSPRPRTSATTSATR